MKYLFFLSLLVALPLSAQEMQVASFTELENDSTALLATTSKLDQNGETAALIRILTPDLQNLTFDGGSLGIVGTEYKGNECWLYVPAYAQRLTISHPQYGVLRNFTYPTTILQGHTYRMVLDIGLGCYVTINSPVPNTEIEIDGLPLGKAPLTQHYLLYGIHTIEATAEQQEATDTIFLSSRQEKEQTFGLHMCPATNHFGNVSVTVEDNAEIYFRDELVGRGSWQRLLREGTYEIETRRENCDAAKTVFVVEAGKDNHVVANPPTENRGWLRIYTRPRKVRARFSDGTTADLRKTQSKSAGTYTMKLKNRYYFPEKRTYIIEHNRITTDTVDLKSRYSSFYMGYDGKALQGNFWHGIVVGYNSWYGLDFSFTGYPRATISDGIFSTKPYLLCARMGWRFTIGKHLAVTPQAGWFGFFVDETGSNQDLLDTGHFNEIMGSLRLEYSPFKMLRFHLSGEYAKDFYQSLDDQRDVWWVAKGRGWSVSIGAVICTYKNVKSKKFTK